LSRWSAPIWSTSGRELTGETMADAGGIVAALRDMASVKNLSDEEMSDLIKDGILAGLARIHGPNVEAEIVINDASGKIEIIVLKRVVAEVEDSSTEVTIEKARWDDPTFELGDVMEIPVEFEQFGRNAVMATKQRIVQRVREGERERIRDEYADRVGELVSGEVQQIERGKMVIMLNRSRDADVIIPWREQNPRERFRQGDPIRAVLKKVDETPKGPRLILSRGDPLFVAALFNLEVPEIYQGIVEIQELAREVGGRTKIAVSSKDESIDPVGACVGMKGSRVQAVVSELGGERIDIVPWHPDPEIFARRALAPARVSKVLCDRETQVITAIVDEDQLSLAIGRNGQNVRLASQLIGWQIDLYGSREWLEKGAGDVLFEAPQDETYEMADFPLDELKIDETTLASLKGAGYSSFLDIIDLEEMDFKAVSGIDDEGAQRLLKLIDELTVVDAEPAEGLVKKKGPAKEASAEDAATGEAAVPDAATPDAEAKSDDDEDAVAASSEEDAAQQEE